MNKQKKDRNMVVLLCFTALVGLANILLNGNFELIFLYLLFMVVSVPTIYFNYSLCKSENKWHSLWRERTPCDGEPSVVRLKTGKIGEWGAFILGLILALIPSI